MATTGPVSETHWALAWSERARATADRTEAGWLTRSASSTFSTGVPGAVSRLMRSSWFCLTGSPVAGSTHVVIVAW
jgi:hypothetical protein